MKKILFKRSNYKNILSHYDNYIAKKYINKRSLKKISINIKYPLFLYKITLFKLSGLVIRAHKKNINSSITIVTRLSKNLVKLNFPFNYGLIKFN